MSILDKLKRKKPEKIEKPKIKKEQPKIERPAEKRTKKKVSDSAYRVVKGPYITEKANDLAKQNQYVFKVFPRANKIQIKKAIERIYRVNVLNVRIVNIPKKPKSFGRIKGWKKGYKKAIIAIKKGQKINI